MPGPQAEIAELAGGNPRQPVRLDKLSCWVVGSINADTTASVQRLPAPGETVQVTGLRRSAGGKGLNQAVMAARFGARVTMLARIGTDADGKWLKSVLTTDGVDVSHLQEGEGEQTGSAFICVAADGENQIVVNSAANSQLRPDSGVGQADIVIAQLEVPPPVIEATIALARGFVCLNVAPARPLATEALERCDLIIANEGEWTQLSELQRLPRVVVTRGRHGCALFENGRERLRVPGIQVDTVDSVGAGDAFVSVVALAVAAGMPMAEALRLGCIAGAQATTRHGAAEAMPDRAELMSLA